MPADEPDKIESKRGLITRRRIIALAMVLTAGLVGLAVFGPKVENYYKCPLTGRDRVVLTRYGVTFSDRTSTNKVSVWAEQNSITGVVAGQCGWTAISTVTPRWFDTPLFGESRAPMIPYSLHQGSIQLPEATPEEALQKYQQAILTACAANESLWRVQQGFLQAGMQ